MTPGQAQTLPKYTPNRFLKDLPEHLKDPKNFEKIQKALLETIRSCTKSHSEPADIPKCPKCTDGMLERRLLMKRLGFKSSAQYMAWRKVHTIIDRRVKLR